MPSSVFDTLTSARHSSASSRRCWRRGGGAAKCEGGWCGSPPRSGPDRGDVSPRREGARAYARTTSPHPSGRSPSSVPALAVSSTAHLHTSCREYPSGARSLTARAAPCLADRVTFATTSDSLASAPVDGLRAGEAADLQVLRARVDAAPARTKKVRQHQRSSARAMGQRACTCDVPCVACEERRLYQHALEISRHGCTCNVQCRRYRRTERFGVPRSFHKWTKLRFRWKKGGSAMP